MTYKVAILGAGYIADWHCRALRGIRSAQLAGVCDRDVDRAQRLADRYRISQSFADLSAMLDRIRPDVVHVLLPPDQHFSAAEHVLRAGVHVLLEKPMALSAEECHSLGKLACEQKRVIGVSHNFLFARAYEQLRADVRAGKLGRLDRVSITWNKDLGQIRSGPFGSWLFRECGNVMLEVGPHSVAHLLDLVGNPDQIHVDADREIELPNGSRVFRRWSVRTRVRETIADLDFSLDAGHTEHSIQVRGSVGSAFADLERGVYLLQRNGASGQEDLDRWSSNRREGRSRLMQGRANLLRYVCGKLKLSRRGSLFGTSILRSLESFYSGLPNVPDERLGAEFSARVVEMCGRLAAGPASTPRVLESSSRHRPTNPDCLVLGGAGFIGQALVHRLVSAGRSVRLLVRDCAGVPIALRKLPVDIVRGDLNNPASLDAAMSGVRDVFHLARGNGKTYDDFVRTDLAPTENVAAACLRHKVNRLIYTSTIDALNTGQSNVIGDTTPTDPKTHLRNPYSRVKAEAERRLLELHRSKNLPVVILRPGVVLGVGTSPFHWGAAWWPTPFVARFWGRGTNPLPLVLVDDVASALVRAGEVDGVIGETINLVAETDITARDYVSALASATRTQIDAKPRSILRYFAGDFLKYCVKVLVRFPERRRPSYHDWRARTNRSRFDCSKAKRLLGWRPITDRAAIMRDGIERPALEWLK